MSESLRILRDMDVMLGQKAKQVRSFMLVLWVFLLGVSWEVEAKREPRVSVLMQAYQKTASASERLVILKNITLLGEKAAPAKKFLVRVSQEKDWKLRREAVIALGHLGAAAIGPHIRSITARSLDTHWEVRMAATQVLYQTAQGAWLKKALPWLVGLVHDARPEVRVAAVEALGRLGKKARHSLPTLLHALRDPHAQVKQEALIAIRSLGRTAVAALPELKRLLKSKDYLTRTLAAQSLAAWGKDAWSASLELGEALADPEMSVRLAAARALAGIGAQGLSVLRKNISHRLLVVRLASVYALRLQLPNKDVVSILQGALKREKAPAMQEALMLTLGHAGDAGAPAVSEMIPFLNASRDALRQAAILGLSQIGRASVPALQKAALTNSWWLRVAALDALGAIGPKAAAAAPSLLACLHHPQWQVRRTAAMVLPAIGAGMVAFWPEQHAVKELIRALLDGQWRVRYAAITALRWFGPKARSAQTALKKQTTAKEAVVRRAALLALAALQGPAKVKRKKTKP